MKLLGVVEYLGNVVEICVFFFGRENIDGFNYIFKEVCDPNFNHGAGYSMHFG